MPRRIQEDHKFFRDVVSGTTNRELQKYIKTGHILPKRGKNGKIAIPIPRIDSPHFVHGRQNEGVASGPGERGDIIGKEPGKGKGGGASVDPGDAIEVAVDLKDILKALGEEWSLPNMLPKQNATFEEVKIRYSSLSKVGPSSLLHKRKTMLETLKRMSATGQLGENSLRLLPGYSVPIKALLPIKDDMRYRQWREIKIPSSNAVIFFARDISGSMGNAHCEIVSDMSWWIDQWIRQFYERTERCYVIHDVAAKEVDENKFYKLRMGGGTVCSSAFKYIAKQLKHRFPPEMWNVYIFYFSDGDNWGDDNEKVVNIMSKELGDKVNLIGMAQILPWGNEGLREHIEKSIEAGKLNRQFVTTTGIDRQNKNNNGYGFWNWNESLDEDYRNQALKNAIQDLLGVKKKQAAVS